MRLKIGGHEVEGSAEEVAALLKLLEADSGRKSVANIAVSNSGASTGASPFVTEDVAFEVLTRRPLGTSYITMLRKLDEAGEAWTTAPKLQEALGFNTREFAGLLGAFGRRISHTPGAATRAFFDQYWDHEKGHNLYRLPPSVRAALRKAKIV